MIGIYCKYEFPNAVNVLDDFGDSQNPRVEIAVDHICGTCDFSMKYATRDCPAWVFNKRSRVMHFAGYEGDNTMCGRIATGESWLWQM